jgi:hypothetical protein
MRPLYVDSEDRGISPKVLGTAFILSVGIFGSGFLGNLGNQLNELKKDTQQPKSKLKGSSENRGSLTSLTRREINTKLRAIPVFFITSDGGQSVVTKDGLGLFFIDFKDAVSFSKEYKDKDVKVSATSLDDVFFTLVEKKTKLGKFIEGNYLP